MKVKLRENLHQPTEYKIEWFKENIDWNRSYEFWEPECWNQKGLNQGDEPNMILSTPQGVIAVNSLDFEFEE